jgi:hypothetical protein
MAPLSDPFPESTFEIAVYDPEPAREKLRARITEIAAATFFAIVMFYLIESSRANETSWPHIKEAMQSILPAVTSVLGTVLGFYFGSQKR